jgi:hypothetical protein
LCLFLADCGILADPLRTPAPLFKAIQDGGGRAFIDPNG